MNRMENNLRSYTKNSVAGRTKQSYLSDEALQELIAATEAEPMICPPKGFRDEIIDRIHQKRKRRKNISLFSYSMKVIAATAAALSIVLIVPENIRPNESGKSGMGQEWQEEEKAEELALQKALSEEEDLEDAWMEQRGFLYRFSISLDEACSKLNGRLNQLVGTEGYY